MTPRQQYYWLDYYIRRIAAGCPDLAAQLRQKYGPAFARLGRDDRYVLLAALADWLYPADDRHAA